MIKAFKDDLDAYRKHVYSFKVISIVDYLQLEMMEFIYDNRDEMPIGEPECKILEFKRWEN